MTPPGGTISSEATPLRGEVWEVHFPAPVGDHPVVVLTSNALIPRIGAIPIAVITGTEGPPSTHVPVDSDAGVSKYPVSWINLTDLHTVPRSRFRRRRGLLSPIELGRIEVALRAVLVL